MTSRRRLVFGTLSAFAARAVAAKQRRARVAIVFTDSPVAVMLGSQPTHALVRTFVSRLNDLGYRDGIEIEIERRSAEGHSERLPGIMREVVAAGADIIVTNALEQALLVTRSVPIVGIVDDAIGGGLAGSLARPDRNFTGIQSFVDPSLNAKRLEILKEAAPTVSRVVFILEKPSGEIAWRNETRDAASRLTLVLSFAAVDSGADFDAAFAEIVRQHADALMIGDNGVNYVHRQRIIDFAAARRLPAMYPHRELGDQGGLICYGPSLSEGYGRLAGYVDRILRGSRPADLPIEQPTRLELVINRRTARALGLKLPGELLLRADAVID